MKLDDRSRRGIHAILADAGAPEGGTRLADGGPSTERGSKLPELDWWAPAAVLEVQDGLIRLWWVSGPEAGIWVEPPDQAPGWILRAGATFEITTVVDRLAFRFQLSSYESDEEILGLLS